MNMLAFFIPGKIFQFKGFHRGFPLGYAALLATKFKDSGRCGFQTHAQVLPS
jgi:hypothetical protein